MEEEGEGGRGGVDGGGGWGEEGSGLACLRAVRVCERCVSYACERRVIGAEIARAQDMWTRGARAAGEPRRDASGRPNGRFPRRVCGRALRVLTVFCFDFSARLHAWTRAPDACSCTCIHTATGRRFFACDSVFSYAFACAVEVGRYDTPAHAPSFFAPGNIQYDHFAQANTESARHLSPERQQAPTRQIAAWPGVARRGRRACPRFGSARGRCDVDRAHLLVTSMRCLESSLR